MKQIFKNVGGNEFKLITESIDNGLDKQSLVRKGLKKVFSSGGKELSYKKIGGVGLGYIKSVSEATKIALQEAREIASEYGYVDNQNQSKFVKEGWAGPDWADGDRIETDALPAMGTPKKHPEANMSNPEEKSEVQIADAILAELSLLPPSDGRNKIEKLARSLKAMHGAEPRDDKNYSTVD